MGFFVLSRHRVWGGFSKNAVNPSLGAHRKRPCLRCFGKATPDPATTISKHAFFLVLLVTIFSPVLLAEPLLQDSNFENGFIVTPKNNPEAENQILQFKNEKPVWRLAQWGSRKNILEGSYEKNNNSHSLQVRDKDEQVIKSLKKSFSNNEHILYLETNGLAEFSGRVPGRLYRKKGEWWPNFLLAQRIKSETFHRYEKIVFSVDAKLEFDKNNKQQGYNPLLHAGRFIVSITVKDIFGANYLWINLPLYDDRFDYSPFGCQKCIDNHCRNIESFETGIEWRCPIDTEHVDLPDGKQGTQKMMFRVGSKEMTDSVVKAGEWQHFEIELLPYIREALKAAKNAPEIERFSRYFNYYYIGSINIGWEVNGLNHAGMSIKNLRLDATLRPRLIDKLKAWF